MYVLSITCVLKIKQELLQSKPPTYNSSDWGRRLIFIPRCKRHRIIVVALSVCVCYHHR